MDALGQLSRLLARHRRRQALAATARGGAWVVAAHGIALALLGWMSVRRPLSDAWLTALACTYLAYLVLPALFVRAWTRRSNSLAEAAKELDHANPGAPDPFQTSLSLGNHAEATRAQLESLFAHHLPKLSLPRPAFLPKPQLIALLGAALAFAAAALSAGRTRDFLVRTAAPWHALANLPILRFAVEPPPEAVGVGDTAVIRGRVSNRFPGQAVYAHVRAAGGETRHPLALEGEGFAFAYGPVQGDFSVHFAGDNGRSSAWKVRALPLPFLESLQAVVRPPGYTRLREDTLPPGIAHFPVLPGTVVRWLARSDRDLAQAVWEMRDSAGTRRDTLALPGSRSFAVDREIRRATEYGWSLVDDQGIRTRQGVPNRIELIPDHPPEVELLEPSADRTLDRDARIPLAFRVKDDFGVASLKLAWRLLSDGQVKAEGRRDGRDWLAQAASGLVETVWNLDSLELRPENVLEFHLVAVDNDTVSGPKSARSAVRTLRMPSIQEVLEASRKQEQSAMANLKSAIQRERQLERKLEREAQAPREEGPPPLAGYEINRIMVDAPREQVRRLESTLEHAERMLAHKPAAPEGARPEAKDRKAASPEARAGIQDLKEHLRKTAPQMPQGNQADRSLEERLKNLEGLMQLQQEQEKRLSKLLDQAAKEPNAELPRSQLDFAQKELKRNLDSQADLKKLFQEEAFQAKAKQDMMEQSAQEQVRLAEDMKAALDDIQKTMEQNQKNGLLSPELKDKMEKIQELLKEVMPDSLQELMQQKMAGQEVDPRELRDQLQKVLGKPGELGENLNRALAMLEQLRDKKRMQEMKQALGELEERERDLAGRIEAGKERTAELDAEQKAIQRDLQKTMDDFARQAEGRQALAEAQKGLKAGPVQKDMQDVRQALSQAGQAGGKPSRAKAGGSARDAADKLTAMQSMLLESMAAMENSVDISVAYELLQESLALSRLQLLIRTGAARRASEGWMDDEPALYGKVAQTSQWLSDRVKAFAATIPFAGSALMAEARNFHVAAKDAARQYNWEAGEKSLHYNQNLSRELLKLIKSAQSGGGGGGGGGASAGGKQQGEQGGGGTGGSQAGGDLSGQLKGMSGKQMAINQATSQLLQAMLEGRRPGGSRPSGGGGEMGGWQPGSQPGGREGPGMEGGPGGEDGTGTQEGEGGQGQAGQGGEGGGTMQGMGNQQGELGERLESLAEALSDESGGGSSKVRKLAQEARELEEAMRGGRLSPEEVRRKQERFQSRLLEAANALEERGQSEERKAEAQKGASRDVAESQKGAESRLLMLLREARRNARSLRLDEGQRRFLEEYYESLLTP